MSMVSDFQEIRKDDVMTAGGKGANLEEIFTEELRKAGRDESKLLEAAKKFRGLIGQGKLPEEVESAVRKKYAQLGEQVRVAVRFSATAEDLPEASFAG